ncbi:hypothetical protein F2Q68_00015656 [Brassica cretica]|uniref:Uncharacterized protein n=1 Tax=Brassica cretica TaxID=69181 RepID=A0A8S9HQM5_BRACR|nr:hypothetical protein F2Q68_00015656 [Brassica cretica]
MDQSDQCLKQDFCIVHLRTKWTSLSSTFGLNGSELSRELDTNGTRAGHEQDASWTRTGRELSDAVANEEEVTCWSCSRSQTSELGSGTLWDEADRGRELKQMREQETRSEFRVRRIAG